MCEVEKLRQRAKHIIRGHADQIERLQKRFRVEKTISRTEFLHLIKEHRLQIQAIQSVFRTPKDPT